MKIYIKIIVLVIVITILIIGSGIYTQKLLYRESSELDDHITKIESSTESEDWVTAEKNLATVQDKWSDIKKTWSILIDHQEIDNIDVTLSRAQKFVKSKDKSSALAETSALLKFIDHIPKKEALNIENIF